MNSIAARWLFIGLLLLVSGVIHAEEGCPSGQIPAGGDMNSCGPIPPGYYNNSQTLPPGQLPSSTPERWADHWGAIATDGPGGSFGAAIDMPGKSQAEQTALADCQAKKGSSSCKIEITYSNQCAAMVMGNTGHNAKSGATTVAAIQSAANVCSSSDTNCHAYYSACSMPQRIQ